MEGGDLIRKESAKEERKDNSLPREERRSKGKLLQNPCDVVAIGERGGGGKKLMGRRTDPKRSETLSGTTVGNIN